MPAIDITGWTQSLLESLEKSRQRQLVILQGPRDWGDRQLAQIAELVADPLLFSDRESMPGAVAFASADTRLGSEAGLVTVDLFSGFNADVLCIAAGLVRAGGLLLLLSPKLEDWDPAADRYGRWQDEHSAEFPWFLEYFFDAIDADEAIGLRLAPDTELPDIPKPKSLRPTPIVNGETAEQTEVLQQIESLLAKKHPALILVSAARGRGKSSLLGMLVARMKSSCRVLVTADSRGGARQLLAHAADAEFVAPDRLLQQAPPADLLVIDEAAMIPQSMLRQLEQLYPRMVMATTSGGYEGTGQGFMLRFVAALEARGLQHFRLQAPVRWCQDDRLEAWLDRTLMLSPEVLPLETGEVDPGSCEIEVMQSPGAAAQRPQLRNVYRLLSAAHYRTRPSDLRMLMENPDQTLLVAHRQREVVAVAWLNFEGGFDADLSESVFLGQRRPRGHLLAQMLTAQAGLRGFACYRGVRVQRIAVAAAWRRRGLGRRLIEHALELARERGCDYLGASFALDPETAPFWQRTGCELVHVSYARGKSSGDQSVAVLLGINPALADEVEALRHRLQQQLPTWMTQFLQFLPAAQAVVLLRMAAYDAVLSRQELDEISAFACGNRGFELAFASLQKFVMRQLAQSSTEVEPLLVEKAVQNRDWNLLERETGASGHKQLQRKLRGLVEALYKD